MTQDLPLYGPCAFPTAIDEFCSRIKTKGVGPQDITALLVRLIRGYFSDAENIKNESLKDRIYKDDSSTGIVIESVGRFTPELAERRPAIYVKRNEWSVQYPGISTGKIFEDPISDVQPLARYVIMISGSHIIISLGKTLAETDVLAEEVFKFLISIQPILVQTTPFLSFRVLGISEPKALKEGRDHFFVTIACRYLLSEQFSIQFKEKEV